MSPNRVPWKEYVLAVFTFPDELQGPTRTRKMGQNVLTKQSALRLVSAHAWTSLMIFIANSRTNLAQAQTVDTRPFSFPREKGLGTRLLMSAIIAMFTPQYNKDVILIVLFGLFLQLLHWGWGWGWTSRISILLSPRSIEDYFRRVGVVGEVEKRLSLSYTGVSLTVQ